MTVLAIIGWLVLIVVGGYITFASAFMNYFNAAFSGRVSIWLFLATLVGVGLLVLAVIVSPIQLVLR